jgi:hypothetical protein
MGMGAIWHCIRYVGGLTGDLLPGGTAGGLLLAGTAAGLLLLGTAGAARAQTLSGYFPAGVPGYDTMPGVTVLTRTRPDYQLPGIPVDSFLVSPSIDESLGYDSNVLGGPGSPSSWTLGTAPTVTVRSDWSRDSVAGVLGLDNTR